MADSVPGKAFADVNEGTKQQDFKSKIYCDPSEEDGESKPAEGFCVECQHYLCDQCFKYHCIPKPSRHHRLLGKNEMPKKKVANSLTEICSKHEGEIMKYYCKTHETVGCNSCMIIEHKPCHEICTLADTAKGVEDSSQYKQFCKKMNEINTELEGQIKIAKQNIEVSKSCTAAAISNIDELQKKINQQFELLRQQIIKEAGAKENSDIERIDGLQESAISAKEDLQNLKDDMQVLEETKQSKQLFIAINKSKKRVKTLEQELDKVKKSNKVRKYSFVPNEFLTSMLKNIDALGELCIHGEGESAENLKSSYGNYPEYGMPRGVPLSDNKLIVLDTIYNRVRLHIKEKGKFVSEVKLTSCPWDVAVIDKNKFAVTMPNEKKIKILSVADEKITESKDISVDARCEGIEYAQEKLIVACNRPAKVLILDMTGKVIQNVSSHQTGGRIFQQPAYILFHEGKTLIYITDRKANCVVTMTTKGMIQNVYRHENMTMPLTVSAEDDTIITSSFENLKMSVINLTTCKISTDEECFFFIGKVCPSEKNAGFLSFCGYKEDDIKQEGHEGPVSLT